MHTLLVSSDAQFDVEHNYMFCNKTALCVAKLWCAKYSHVIGAIRVQSLRVCIEIPVYPNYPATRIAPVYYIPYETDWLRRKECHSEMKKWQRYFFPGASFPTLFKLIHTFLLVLCLQEAVSSFPASEIPFLERAFLKWARESFPEMSQATSLRGFQCVSVSWPQLTVRRRQFSGKHLGTSNDMCRSRANQGCVGQRGATTTKVAFSSATFFSTLNTLNSKHQGGLHSLSLMPSLVARHRLHLLMVLVSNCGIDPAVLISELQKRSIWSWPHRLLILLHIVGHNFQSMRYWCTVTGNLVQGTQFPRKIGPPDWIPQLCAQRKQSGSEEFGPGNSIEVYMIQSSQHLSQMSLAMP